MASPSAANSAIFDPAAYGFELDASLIAQEPSAERGASRMLVALATNNAAAPTVSHRRSRDFAAVVGEFDQAPLIVLNNSKVVPARLQMERSSDGRMFELLFCAPAPGMGQGTRIEAWVRGAKRLREGDVLVAGRLHLRSMKSVVPPSDTRCRCFEVVSGEVMEACSERASLPLPPYIERPGGVLASDTQRYQTVYARDPGSIAAPTAGLHFDEDALAGLDVVEITLHVGPGTFLPLQGKDLRKHVVPAERARITAEAAERITQARAQGRPVLAVGTTVTRTLEFVAKAHGGAVVAYEGPADLVIIPGHHFKVVDVLLTNFHLPASSLLVLVAAFAGRERVLSLYQEAMAQRYRFYSYGDCMLIRRAAAAVVARGGLEGDGTADGETGGAKTSAVGTQDQDAEQFAGARQYAATVLERGAGFDSDRIAETLAATLGKTSVFAKQRRDDELAAARNGAFAKAEDIKPNLRQRHSTARQPTNLTETAAGQFEVRAVEAHGSARAAVLQTAHGPMQTPCFMPVGTYGAVKGLTAQELIACGSQTILGNAYHLSHRPGADLVARLGGLHAMMGWAGPILTDSGGYQVFSLRGLQKIDEQGVDYQTHFDGSRHRMTPRSVLEGQALLGSDICMILDHCPPGDAAPKLALQALERTQRWAEEAAALRGSILAASQLSFCIAQGGTDLALRERALTGLCGLDFDGVALGGLSVGESIDKTHSTLRAVVPWMPVDRPRYVMGIGTPLDLLVAIESGVDMFDCVMPTRHARNGQLFTWRGKINIRHARYREDPSPPEGDLHAELGHPWLGGISLAYLRHLHVHDDPLYVRLATLQNLWFYHSWVGSLREALLTGAFEERRALHWGVIARYYPPKASGPGET